MHISDATLSALASLGWTIYGMRACKLVRNAAPAGTLSNGDRTVSMSFCGAGRWLTCEDGFSTAFDMDSREWVGRPEAFAREADSRVAAHFRH